MNIPIYQIDAFTNKTFGGNPAAVCPLDQWLDDRTLQHIAAENNLSETAYFTHNDDGTYHLRWFTPNVEVDLCGHATLAAAHVLFQHLGHKGDTVAFHTRSGELTVKKEEDGMLTMNFPSRPAKQIPITDTLTMALGAEPKEVYKARDLIAVFDSEQEIANILPDFETMLEIDALIVVITAKGKKSDFVSRCFAPIAGIDEDPVTGSAHCSLIPYWAERLGKNDLHALQVSKRRGELFCKNDGDRVEISGHAVTFLTGNIHL